MKKPEMTSTEKMVEEAFELLDWLDSNECGGVKPEPYITDVKQSSPDTVVVSYRYYPTCSPCTGVIYHLTYDTRKTYTDIFRIVNGKLKVENAFELRGLIGEDDIFKNYRNHPWDSMREKVKDFGTKWGLVS